LLKIIVAEDDWLISDLVSGMLEKQGYAVACAEDGEQAFELIRQEIPLLIISDVYMPGMGGERLFAKVRALGVEYSTIPFIFLTGDDDESRYVQRMMNGANGHIRKPFSFDVLSAHVTACLSNSKRHAVLLEKKFGEYSELMHNVGTSNRSLGEPRAHIQQTKDSAPHESQMSDDELFQQRAYIRSLIDNLESQHDLLPTNEADLVTSWLVLSVAEAHLSGALLFTSDLYHAAPSAKTTINSRMNLLVDKDILCKRAIEADGRRQSVHLTYDFSMRFFTQIDRSIERLRDFLV
jgi:DNA-binding response OmpR family regulator